MGEMSVSACLTSFQKFKELIKLRTGFHLGLASLYKTVEIIHSTD